MIEYMKLLVTVLAGVCVLVSGMGVLALVMLIISDVAERHAWVYPVVGILLVILVATTVAYFTGLRAPW